MPISTTVTLHFLVHRLNFDEEPIFNVENIDKSLGESTETVPVPEQLEISPDDFQLATKTLFDEFMAEIEVNFSVVNLLSF